MKKIEKYIYLVLALIVLAMIVSSIIFIVTLNNQDKQTMEAEENNQSNNEEVTLEDSIKLNRTYKLDDLIIEEFTITLNNKISTFKIEYQYNHEEDDNYLIINGNFKEDQLITLASTKDEESNYTKEDIFTTENIETNFNEDNFSIIKGTDNKSYLLIQTRTDNSFDSSELYVYNDELKLISANIITAEESPDYFSHNGFIIDNFYGNIPCEFNNSNPLYKRTLKKVNEFSSDYQYVKIENNKIYFLYPKIKEDLSGGILEERIYTINNNNLEYETGNTYTFNSVCQQI